jgi:ABC-2 type transport system ATP-binding protein
VSSGPAASLSHGERDVPSCATPPGMSQLDRDAAISVRGLRKTYGAFVAVAGIDLDIHRGEIVAFLGPNGAGKTTTVEILEGYRKRTSGEVRVLGQDPEKAPLFWRDRIGVVLQESEIEPHLTARECVELYAGYHLRPRPVMETLELVGLTAKAGTRGSQLSGGQRRRLDVALALIGDPELVFLDEPTTGFDPSARRQAWDVIDGLRSLGKTIFLTTHYMEEAERLADRIMVVARGTIVAEGTPSTLGGRDSRPAVVTVGVPDGFDVGPLPEQLSRLIPAPSDGRVQFASEEPLQDLVVLADWADAKGLQLRDLEVRRPTLEDIYLELTTDTAVEPTQRKELA